jgi:serine/threonine protein kinase
MSSLTPRVRGELVEYRKLGSFNVEKTVASGGMGQIFRSVDSAGRKIALKTILKKHQGDEKFRELFIREAEITFVLDHPNIVRAYRFDKVGEKLMLALEYLEGVNLKDILRKVYEEKLVIPMVVIVEIMRRVLRGLDYAHKKKDRFGRPLGIVHRDLNPANVFVTYGGEVKILDFGISKATEKEVHQLTPNGELRGKMCYLAPEQIENEKIDRRADVFACGIVMWELITGHPLFLKDSEAQVLEAIRSGEYTSAQYFRRDLPRDFNRLLQKALKQDLKDRFQDCAEFERELVRVMREHYLPGSGQEDISAFVCALFKRNENPSDPHFLSSHAWLLSQIRGREEQALQLARRIAEEYSTSPAVNLNLAKVLLVTGHKIEGLRLLKKLARVDSIEIKAQEVLEWLGVRRSPVFSFLNRSHPVNRLFGLARHKVLGPTPFQQAFLAA